MEFIFEKDSQEMCQCTSDTICFVQLLLIALLDNWFIHYTLQRTNCSLIINTIFNTLLHVVMLHYKWTNIVHLYIVNDASCVSHIRDNNNNDR